MCIEDMENFYAPPVR